ncbi:MAG: agmatinase [Candidatus Hodarchaeales archaeon]
MNNDQYFGSSVHDLSSANLISIGIPWDASSSYRKGSVKAPDVIRQATSSKLFNPYTESLFNVKKKWRIYDSGNIQTETSNALKFRDKVFTTLKNLYANSNIDRFLFLGGDHLITYFCFHSLSELGFFQKKKVGILYLDAHPDLYIDYSGNKYSHACVLQRIIEQTEIDPKNIIQVGLRASTPDQMKFGAKTGIRMISKKEFLDVRAQGVANIIRQSFSQSVDSIYLSVDLDVLDPAYAPGVGNPEPAGMSTQNLVELFQELSGLPFFACDIVELCPAYDVSNITAFAAAKLIKEILAIIT